MRRAPVSGTGWGRRWAVGLVVLACWVSALWPAWSQAVSARVAEGQGWVQVCSATGMAWVNWADDGPTDPQPLPGSGGLGHGDCPWCGLHSAPWAVPPAPAVGVAPPALGLRLLPLAFSHSPRPLHAWSALHSRAPPSVA